MEEIRLLDKADMELRVAQTTAYNDNGVAVVKCSLLLYKNARVDMKILDELYTPMGWRRTHKLIGNNLYCLVEVWDAEKREWIGKEDVGTESATEAEKGQASDAFKRACVNWGIGRELYSAPRISVTLTDREYRRGQDGRMRVTASFSVGEIGYDTKTRTINSLTVVDRFGNVRYAYGKAAERLRAQASSPQTAAAAPPQQPPKKKYQPMSEEDYWKIIRAYACGMKTKTGGDYRETWIQLTNAGTKEQKEFDIDVDKFKVANNIIEDI